MADLATSAGDISLEDKVAYLSRPDSYPERPARVEALQTHMSWVFLTDRHAYKLKKPARTTFLDFSTLAARRHSCEEEVRLNRRLAEAVYLGLVALTASPEGGLRLHGEGESAREGSPVEWLVKMRRLPRECMLDAMLRKQTVTPADVRNVAAVLMAFYRGAAREPLCARDYLARIERDLAAHHAALRTPPGVLNTSRLDQLQAAHARFLRDHGDLLEDRAARGRIVEAHGDLRPEHICLLSAPVVIDCLEFNRDFRMLDPAHELAYLAMECDLLGAPWVGAELFDAYRAEDTEAPDSALIRFYRSERAVLRAKLALWHLRDHAAGEHARWIGRAEAYLSLAAQYCAAL